MFWGILSLLIVQMSPYWICKIKCGDSSILAIEVLKATTWWTFEAQKILYAKLQNHNLKVLLDYLVCEEHGICMTFISHCLPVVIFVKVEKENPSVAMSEGRFPMST